MGHFLNSTIKLLVKYFDFIIKSQQNWLNQSRRMLKQFVLHKSNTTNNKAPVCMQQYNAKLLIVFGDFCCCYFFMRNVCNKFVMTFNFISYNSTIKHWHNQDSDVVWLFLAWIDFITVKFKVSEMSWMTYEPSFDVFFLIVFRTKSHRIHQKENIRFHLCPWQIIYDFDCR